MPNLFNFTRKWLQVHSLGIFLSNNPRINTIYRRLTSQFLKLLPYRQFLCETNLPLAEHSRPTVPEPSCSTWSHWDTCIVYLGTWRLWSWAAGTLEQPVRPSWQAFLAAMLFPRYSRPWCTVQPLCYTWCPPGNNVTYRCSKQPARREWEELLQHRKEGYTD